MRNRTQLPDYHHRLVSIIFLGLFSVEIAAAAGFELDFLESEISRAINDPDHDTSIIVQQPIELVFNALLMRLAEYSENITSVEFDNSHSENGSSIGVGSQRITTMSDGKRLVQRIVIFDPPQRFSYFTDMSLSTVSVPIDYSIGYYTFEQMDVDRVRAKVSVAYKPSSRLTAFLVRIGFNRALVRDFEKAEAYLNSLSNNP